MTVYVGTKVIKAVAMNRQNYNVLRDWKVPSDENPLDEGYLVEYEDANNQNHPAYLGYISWSPKGVFEASYKTSGNLTFGDAVFLAKQGYKLARSGWNGKGMCIFLVAGSSFVTSREPLNSVLGEGKTVNYQPHLDMLTADRSIVPWLASQSDVLAEDWCIVE